MTKTKIVTLSRASKICQHLHKKQQKIVLVGGVFDILHYGHLRFLQAAKKAGDVLVVALEGDKNVRRKKGRGRPINPAGIRAEIIAELNCVDYAIILPEMRAADYYNLVRRLQPDIIAVTQNDPQLKNKKRQARSVGADLAVVSPRLLVPSTTRIARILELE